MCGVFGVIGEAKHPKATYRLLTQLMVKTEPRGDKATGFWATQAGSADDPDRSIIYHKLPIKPTAMASADQWKGVEGFNPNLLIGHCRAPTGTSQHGQHQGPPAVNRNNHPHVSDNHRVALIHNGVLDEYHAIKAPYKDSLRSQCDSELLLHMFAVGEGHRDNAELLAKRLPDIGPPAIAYRLLGVTEIYARVNHGAMAVAVGEHLDAGRRALWLFRDSNRPLTLIDLQAELGQIFFCSTPEIWRDAFDSCPAEVRNLVPLDHKVTNFRPFYTYRLEVGGEAGIGRRMFKMGCEKILQEGDEDVLIPKKGEPQAYSAVRVVTDLDQDDEPIRPAKEEKEPEERPVPLHVLPAGPAERVPSRKGKRKRRRYGRGRDDERQDDARDDSDVGGHSRSEEALPVYDRKKLESLVQDIKEAAEEIEVSVFNLSSEYSMSESAFNATLEALTDILRDLQGAKYAATKTNAY